MTSHEKASNRTLMGKCFCGAVNYAVPDEFLYAMNCHCSNCRLRLHPPWLKEQRGETRQCGQLV